MSNAKIQIISENETKIIDGITLKDFNSRKCSGKVYAHKNTMCKGDFVKLKEADSIVIDPFSSVPAGVTVIKAVKLNDSKASKYFGYEINNGYITLDYIKSINPSTVKNGIYAFEIVEDYSAINKRSNIVITGKLVDKVVPISSVECETSKELTDISNIRAILDMLESDSDTSNLAMSLLATSDYKHFPVEVMIILNSCSDKIYKSNNSNIKEMLKYFGFTPETIGNLNITTATNFLRTHGLFTKENAFKLSTYFSNTYASEDNVWKRGYRIDETFNDWD